MSQITVGFTGDVAFSGYFSNADPLTTVSPEIKTEVRSCDYTVFNVEGPITTQENTGEALKHKNAIEVIPFINDLSSHPIAALANNHMMDYGGEGLIDTINHLEQNNLMYLGAGHDINEAAGPLIIMGGEIKIALFNFTYKHYLSATNTQPGTYYMEDALERLPMQIEKLRASGVDWCIAICHMGEEFLEIPMKWTQRSFHQYADYGIDIVVAHHPHVIQGYESFMSKNRPKAIFYSLGNFVFDTDFQRQFKGTDKGIFLKINFQKDQFDFEPIFSTIERNIPPKIIQDGASSFTCIDNISRQDYYLEAGKIKDVDQERKVFRNSSKSNNTHKNLRGIIGKLKRIILQEKERTVFLGSCLRKAKGLSH